ncbi:UNVERIFIED_CONTAM: hypothetical protein FKN15_041009 [Acipenser sinensis]
MGILYYTATEFHCFQKGTQFLLEACIQENVKSFIYTSSFEVAGPKTQRDPVINGNEDTVYSCSLKFPYSKTKFQAEQLVLQVNGEVLKSLDKIVPCGPCTSTGKAVISFWATWMTESETGTYCYVAPKRSLL